MSSDLTAQGLARQPRDPRAALADYEARPEAQPALSDGPAEQGERPCREPGPHRGGHRGAGPGPRPQPGLRAGPCRPGRIARPARPARGRARRRPGDAAKGYETVHRLSGRRHLCADVPSGTRRPPGSFRLLGSALEPGSRVGPDRPRSRSGRNPRPGRVPQAGRSGAGSPQRAEVQRAARRAPSDPRRWPRKGSRTGRDMPAARVVAIPTS